MFETLKEFSNIVVSGPQRSGTRIAAKIIAADTGKTYVDEKYIDFHNLKMLEYFLIHGNNVVQCPALCHLLHYIMTKNTLIIIVRRPIEEIIKSERRSWNEQAEKIELLKYGCTGGIISEIKYYFWDFIQKDILDERGREIHYHTLEQHPLFIKERQNFRWDQTE
ncbi:MAG: hypothetical protein KKH70_20335 [Gammaproteobacteria bacterium]|uniref:Uncharacterized protein n=1 Tax=viral metagenome TaxID=1070528 RepID=A0A6H1ZN04_9ZZZZ|nr:hypothetical protein [Gammaproteobacteria bacterium]MBU2395689.1 hypothetical protein [Gammaproteobacteria bacterium]